MPIFLKLSSWNTYVIYKVMEGKVYKRECWKLHCTIYAHQSTLLSYNCAGGSERKTAVISELSVWFISKGAALRKECDPSGISSPCWMGSIFHAYTSTAAERSALHHFALSFILSPCALRPLHGEHLRYKRMQFFCTSWTKSRVCWTFYISHFTVAKLL